MAAVQGRGHTLQGEQNPAASPRVEALPLTGSALGLPGLLQAVSRVENRSWHQEGLAWGAGAARGVLQSSRWAPELSNQQWGVTVTALLLCASLPGDPGKGPRQKSGIFVFLPYYQMQNLK